MKLLTLIFVAGLCSAYSAERCDYSKHECMIGTLMLLPSPLERVPSNQKEMEEYCKLVDGMQECVDEVKKTCPNDKAMKVLSDSLTSQVRDVCKSESQRKLIMDKAACLKDAGVNFAACLRMEAPTNDESDRKKKDCVFNTEFVGCVSYEAEKACSKNGRAVAETLYKPLKDFMDAYCTTD